MATRTTTTRTTSGGCVPSADLLTPLHPEFSFSELVQAYIDCRRSKRSSATALQFELSLERNLFDLDAELRAGTYRPGQSICFVITHPKPREVWAAQFRDRIVHHLLYNKVTQRIEARFIADSSACIPERGTLYAAQRLEQKARRITQGWTRSAYYLKCDLRNFFVSIDKRILSQLLIRHIPEPWWQSLALQILWHDPRQNYELRGSAKCLRLVPPHKRLASQDSNHGLPIGNLSSQFFANIYLNELDRFVKHQLRCQHYARYVDDFVLLHSDEAWLNDARAQIETFLDQHLSAELAHQKTILQPVYRGIDFVGQVILPGRRVTRRRTVHRAVKRVLSVPQQDLRDTANSYLGLIRQASGSRRDQAKVARAVLLRGRPVDMNLTKTFQSRGAA